MPAVRAPFRQSMRPPIPVLLQFASSGAWQVDGATLSRLQAFIEAPLASSIFSAL